MQSATMIKQILDFNKKAFEDSFNAIIAVQENTEKMTLVFGRNSEYFPEDGKKVVANCIQTCKKGLDEFKASVGSWFKLVEDYFQNAADQMESSFSAVVKQTQLVNPAVDCITKKVAADEKKAAPRKPAVKKEKLNRKKIGK